MGCGFYICSWHKYQMQEQLTLDSKRKCNDWEYSNIRAKYWAQVSEIGKQYVNWD